MASAFLEELRAFQPEGPIFFWGGFCLGGLLALEMAEQLHGGRASRRVLVRNPVPSIRLPHALQAVYHLASALVVPHQQTNRSGTGESIVVRKSSRSRPVQASLGSGSCPLRDRLPRQDRQRPGKVHCALISAAYLRNSWDRTQRKAHAEILAPGIYQGDVVLFRASRQLSGLVADGDEYLGWKQVLHGNLEVCEVPGHQQNMSVLEPRVARLAKETLPSAQDRAAAASSRQDQPTLIHPVEEPAIRLVSARIYGSGNMIAGVGLRENLKNFLQDAASTIGTVPEKQPQCPVIRFPLRPAVPDGVGRGHSTNQSVAVPAALVSSRVSSSAVPSAPAPEFLPRSLLASRWCSGHAGGRQRYRALGQSCRVPQVKWS